MNGIPLCLLLFAPSSGAAGTSSAPAAEVKTAVELARLKPEELKRLGGRKIELRVRRISEWRGPSGNWFTAEAPAAMTCRVFLPSGWMGGTEDTLVVEGTIDFWERKSRRSRGVIFVAAVLVVETSTPRPGK